MKKKLLFLLIILIGFTTVKAYNNNNINIKNLYDVDINNLFNLNNNIKKYYKIKKDKDKFIISESTISESNINFDYILKSDIDKIHNLKNFNIVDNNGMMYLFNKDKIELDDKIDYLSVYNDEMQLILSYDKENMEWIFTYPTVLVSSGLVNKYYMNLNDAILNSVDNDVIYLIRNQIVDNVIVVDKSLTINGNGNQIKTDKDYLFMIDKTSNKVNITFNNVNLKVNSFIKMNNSIDKIYLNDVIVSYKKIGMDSKYSNSYVIGKNTVFSLPLN